MTPADIKALLDKATPGPWEQCDIGPTEIWRPGEKPIAVKRYADGKLLVSAPGIIRQLLEQLSVARKALECIEAGFALEDDVVAGEALKRIAELEGG